MLDQDLWQNILDQLEFKIAESSFKTWFTNTLLVEVNNDSLTIKVPNKFTSEYLNKNYSELVSEVTDSIYKKKYEIRFIHNLPYQNEDNPKKAFMEQNPDIRLNQKYTFADFVVGKSNNFAHSAALAVAESPGTTYNPLFLYGESGMGKTHLMQAIGHYVHGSTNKYNIFYITTEQFTNMMIESIRTNTTQQFRNKFRNIDLLLVDDIHFLSKKEGSQEEFFHTFNALYENKKQIVITSDRPPKEIGDLEKRLITRFEWGLLADLKNPDFETRVAILKKKAATENILLTDEVIEFISDNVSSNIRALEGSLIRILAYSSYNNMNPENIDIPIIQDILSDIITVKAQEITMDTVFQKVCKYYNITPSQMLDKSRKHIFAFPRQVAMYLSDLLIPNISLKDIAAYYRRNDHTTAIHAKKMIEKKFHEDNNFRIQIEQLIKEIKGLIQ
ncbi:MAG: chromosomal replication initiator protein DnaA [Candidatus Cloacimonetes bacterium]|nr:chromosomal replication initiator protein DnaA [Candidatus Cloacimonadota bacterium]